MTPYLLYRLPLPRTKVEVPVPAGTARGHVDVDGRRWPVEGWPATVGHNWGAHPPSVDAIAPEGANLEVPTGRLRLGVTATGNPAGTTLLTYRDPQGGTRTVAHCGLATLVLTLRGRDGRTASHAGTCAFEVGSATGWPGLVPLQLPLEPA